MTVTAIIPAYNAAKFLDGTLASVFTQTRKPDEVIVVDDASTDGTAAIAKRLGANVLVLPTNSGGPATPLNAGIAAATGDWIALLDHDDRWRPDWLANALTAEGEFRFGRVVASPPNTGLQGGLDQAVERLKNEGNQNNNSIIISGSRAYELLVPMLNYCVTCSNMIFSRRLGIEIGFDPHAGRCCDYRFLQCVAEHNNITLIDAISCDWINSESSLYQRGAMDALDRDLMSVYRQFKHDHISSLQIRDMLRVKCRGAANDLAYAARVRGEYRRAFRDYCDSLRYGGINITALMGIAKLPAAMMRGRRT